MRSRRLESLGIAAATLRENPLRTVLSTSGVVIGVASLVSVLSVGDGMERLGRQEIERTTGVQTVVLTPQLFDEINGRSIPRKDFPVFSIADAKNAERFSGAASANLLLSAPGIVETSRGRRATSTLNATLASNVEFSALEFSAGRYFSEAEAQRSAPVVVLSHRLAEELHGTGQNAEDLVGHTVRVNGEPRRVLGILASYRGERVRVAYLPIQGAREVFPTGGRAAAPTLYLKASSIERVPAIEELSSTWLAQRLGQWEGRVKVETSAVRLAQVSRGVTTFKLFLGAITGISLVVGGIGIMNVLLASVAERTREIGVRIAIGARRRDIVSQFLAESVAIAAVGSILGIVLGTAATFAITAILQARTEARIDASLSFASVAIAVAAAVVVGVCCGIYPAVRASRLSPIEAIRND